MRVSPYLRSELKQAIKSAFGDARPILFGSRVDDSKRGGDFDIAIVTTMDKKAFKKARIAFLKYLLLRDLDLPIDLIHYESADTLLRSEIDRVGQRL